MRWHNHKGIDAEMFLLMAKAKAVADDLASRLANENGKPLDERVGEVVDAGVGRNAIGFHGRDCMGQKGGKSRDTSLVGGPRRGARRPSVRDGWHGQETVPQLGSPAEP